MPRCDGPAGDTAQPPSLLFIADNEEDYMSDSMLHGFRTLLGARAVDMPKRDLLYDSCPPDVRARLYGNGFTLYGTLPDRPDVDRHRAMERAARGEFDVVVFGDAWRRWGPWLELASFLAGPGIRTRVAFVDGGDRADLFPYGPAWWRAGAAFAPRPHQRVTTFKREWAPRTSWLRFYGLVPPALADRLPWGRRIRPISFSIPEGWIAPEVPAKTQDFPRHVVDDELREHLGIPAVQYTFAREADYQADLRRSRFGITTRRAGWDTLRHLEIAASGCVLCFRDLASKPARSAPFGLDETNSISYRDTGDLLSRIAALAPARERALQEGALRWARANTTTRRARQVLEELGAGIPAGGPPSPGG